MDFAGTSVQKKASLGHWLFRPIKLPPYEFTVEMVRVKLKRQPFNRLFSQKSCEIATLRNLLKVFVV